MNSLTYKPIFTLDFLDVAAKAEPALRKLLPSESRDKKATKVVIEAGVEIAARIRNLVVKPIKAGKVKLPKHPTEAQVKLLKDKDLLLRIANECEESAVELETLGEFVNDTYACVAWRFDQAFAGFEKIGWYYAPKYENLWKIKWRIEEFTSRKN